MCIGYGSLSLDCDRMAEASAATTIHACARRAYIVVAALALATSAMLRLRVPCSRLHFPDILDKRSYLFHIFAPIGLDPAADIDSPGVNLGNGLSDILWR